VVAIGRDRNDRQRKRHGGHQREDGIELGGNGKLRQGHGPPTPVYFMC
jgi:hypothetical protein